MSGFIEKPRYACPLGGAMATTVALPRTAPILHSSLGCGGNSIGAIMGAAGHMGSGYCGGASAPSSGISEQQIVFGGIARLEEQLQSTAEIIDADLFIVITGCTAEIIGDDVAATVRAYNETANGRPPLIHASAAGFKGNSHFGYDSVLQSLFRDYVTPTDSKKKGHVNLWGAPPSFDVFWEGNLLELRRILEAIGLTVNSFFTDRDSLPAIRAAAEAELNIVISPVNGVPAAELFRELHKTDYIATDLPIGAKATEAFVRNIARRLRLGPKKVEHFLTSEKKRYYHFFNRTGDSYSDLDFQRYVVIVADTTYAISLTRFASQELGWIPALVAITDPVTDEKKTELTERFNGIVDDPETTVVFETDTSEISGHFFERWPRPGAGKYHRAPGPLFVIGSRLDKDFADSVKAGHVSAVYPISNRVALNRAYAGYTGALTLTEDILSVLVSNR